ncbi:MAG TPA: hypothetical protein PL195_08170, partial [bacterium]|nr:hypothetical protein [bacterium]
MNKLFLFLTALMLFVLPSCSTFINLGDSEKSGTNGEDYLPEELSDEEQKESDAGNSGDTGNSGNTGEMSDTGNSGDTGNTGNSGDSGDSGNTGTDDEVSDEDSSSLNGYPFDESFTNETCSCGTNPEYDPVCCNGSISVFNACFANCYGIHSSGRICSSYKPGVCGSVIQPVSDDDIVTDEIIDEDIMYPAESVPDEDIAVIDSDSEDFSDDDIFEETPDNECGCFPS